MTLFTKAKIHERWRERKGNENGKWFGSAE